MNTRDMLSDPGEPRLSRLGARRPGLTLTLTRQGG
jgi:hypothetical protein